MARSRGTRARPTDHPSPDLPPSERELVVLTRPEVGLRASSARILSATNADVGGLEELLAAEGATMVPLFGVQEDALVAQSARFADVAAADVPPLAVYYRVLAADDRLDDLAAKLADRAEVEAAFVKPPAHPAMWSADAAPSAAEPPAGTPDFALRQGYLDAAPGGIDARFAWTRRGGAGAGVRIVDVEGAWQFSHEDLAQNQGGVVGGTPSADLGWRNHGTAVVGTFSADRNAFGVTGICPDAPAVALLSMEGSGRAVRVARKGGHPMTRLMVKCAQLAAVLLLTASPARADEPRRTHEITLDDYFTLATVFEAAISPDGKSVGYAEARWQSSTNDRKADLWVVDVGSGEATRLTFDRAGYSGLQWAPDSEHVYVAAARKRGGANEPPYDGKVQAWRIPLKGGEPLAVTQVPGGIDQFRLAGDGRTLYYATSRREPGGEWTQLRKDFKDVQYGHGQADVTEVHRVDLRSWRTEKVADLKKAVSEMAVSPDGRRLGLITAPEDKVLSFEGKSAVEILDVASGTLTPLPDDLWRAKVPSPYGRLNSLAWSKDGRSLAFVIAFDGYPSEVMVAQWDGPNPTLFKLDRPEGVSLHASVDSPLSRSWRGGTGEFCYLGEEKGRVRIYCATRVQAGQAPQYRCLTPGDVAVDSFSLDAAGDLAAAILGGPGHLPDVFLVGPRGGPRRLTNVNPQAGSWKWPRLDVVRWKGAKGADVEGVLELPADATPGRPLPTIVYLHGGPTAMWPYQRSFNFYSLQTLMSSRGYAIFCPNYRGSSGYGDAFLTDLIGRENEIEAEDILKGVDAMVERKVADPDRLAVVGWSNGGYLTNCLITKTGRFKAASSGAGIAEKVMEWGINDEPAFSLAFAQGLPWEKPVPYRRASPVFDFGKVRTPTLFHVGGGDERCPPEHSRMLYRALREYLKVPTELLVYPGEPHGLGRYQSRKAKMAWDAAWIDHHVLGKPAGK
jgi:dipeptidyl aminopeptidase/acylaminoacyl peptidase